MNKIRVAVIGHGNLGRYHSDKAYDRPEVEFIGVVDIDEKARISSQERHPDVKVFSNIKDVVDLIDAAVIVTPISTHFEVAKFFLENGKDVFCEKSLASNLKQAQELHDLAQEKKLVLQVGHSERFHGLWQKIDKSSPFFSSGKGIIRINRIGLDRGRDLDVGVVEDLMVHDVDLISYLFNERPNLVKAFGEKYSSDYWVSVTAELSFSSGKKAYIQASKNHVRVLRELELVNAAGAFYADLVNLKFYQTKLSQNEDSVSEISYEKRDHLMLEHESFYRSIQERGKAVVSSEDALNVIKVLDAINKSLESGEEVSL